MNLPPLDPRVASLVTASGGAVVLAASVIGAWLVRGTTAVPAAVWAAVASAGLVATALAEGSGGLANPSASATARLVVAALAVCPAMALLGAKRPQHGVWQVIVLSLAAVLAMPAASAMLVRPGSLPDVHLLERSFFVALVAAGWLNFLGTGKTAAATLVTLGMLLVIRPFLPGVDTAAAIASPWGEMLGSLSCGLGAVAAFGSRRRAAAEPITSAFLAVRDTIGIAWTLRIAERFNAIAESRGWPCRLTAAGLEAGGDPGDTSWRPPAGRVFESLMRRFVTRDWLARHSTGGSA